MPWRLQLCFHLLQLRQYVALRAGGANAEPNDDEKEEAEEAAVEAAAETLVIDADADADTDADADEDTHNVIKSSDAAATDALHRTTTGFALLGRSIMCVTRSM